MSANLLCFSWRLMCSFNLVLYTCARQDLNLDLVLSIRSQASWLRKVCGWVVRFYLIHRLYFLLKFLCKDIYVESILSNYCFVASSWHNSLYSLYFSVICAPFTTKVNSRNTCIHCSRSAIKARIWWQGKILLNYFWFWLPSMWDMSFYMLFSISFNQLEHFL